MTSTEADERATGWPRWASWCGLAASAGLIVVWWGWTNAQPHVHIDHAAFLRTIGYMRDGEGYYAAMQQAFHDIGVTIGHPRGYRIPTAFLVWRWIPTQLLWGVFLVGVVGSSAVLAQRLARTPWSPVVVTFFMLAAGRSAGGYGLDAWMLVELWLVPLALGAVIAWRGGHDVTAALLALAATMVRETAAVFIMGGLLAAVLERRVRWPWIAATVAAITLYLLHFQLSGPWVEPPGNFAKLFGSGAPPASVFQMIGWTVVRSWFVAGLLWVFGGWGIWRSRERWLLLPVLCMPLNGFVVDRPYWGIMLMPFLLIYGIDEVTASVRRRARSGGTAGEGSSPPPGTQRLARGNLAAEPVPPSA